MSSPDEFRVRSFIGRSMTARISWLQLLRIPTVFTAIADICAGFLLTHLSAEPRGEFWLLIGSSSCLYLAGMVFNDVFDRKIDAQERPERPIPSGRISPGAAVSAGCVLIILGNILAWCVGMNSLKIALILTAAVLAYDGMLRKTPLGPVAMGVCRFLNVMLGASAIGFWPSIWARPQLQVAIGIGVYVIGLTWFARREATHPQRWQLILAAIVVNLGVLVLADLASSWPGDGALTAVFTALGVTTIAVNGKLLMPIVRPEPARVQAAVVTMLMSIIMLDAIMVFFKTGETALAAMTAVLLLPTLVLRKLVPMT